MPEVTDIKQQVRRRNRVSVYLDGEFWTGMSVDTYADLGLQRGQRFDEAHKRELEAQVAKDEALQYCLNLLSERARTRWQVSEKLKGREFGEEVIAACLRRCEELLLLDDDQFARDATESRLERGDGPTKIREYLRRVGIDREQAQQVVEEVFADRELDVAQRALHQRFAERLGRRERDRATAFLLRRGFAGDIVRRVVAEHSLTEQEQREQEDPEEALAVLRRRYTANDLHDRATAQKAWAFLARRGYSSDTARRTLERARAESET